MLALSAAGCTVFRANVGLFYTKDGRPIKSGLPTGFSDLFGFRPDGTPFFVEVKSEAGRVSAAQEKFLAAMRERGAIAVVSRSADECLKSVIDYQRA